jgi:hypothetical protein
MVRGVSLPCGGKEVRVLVLRERGCESDLLDRAKYRIRDMNIRNVRRLQDFDVAIATPQHGEVQAKNRAARINAE